MSFTYTPSELGASKLFQVRLRIGDTNEGAAWLQDEEIDHLLAGAGGVVASAAVDSVKAILAQNAGRPDSQSALGTSISWGQARERLEALLDELRGSAAFALPRAGGISLAGINAEDGDADRPIDVFDETGPGD